MTTLKVTYSNDARKALRRMPANRAASVLGKIAAYAEDPASQANNVKKLQGGDGLRLRVGEYRVIFDIEDGQMRIIDIGPRGSIYG